MVSAFWFLLGLVVGFVATVSIVNWLGSVPAGAAKQSRPSIAQALGFKPAPRSDSKPVPLAPMARGARSWRLRRLELQREHNSQQKERERQLPAM